MLVFPHQVHNLFMGEYGITRSEGRAQADKYDQRQTPREMSLHNAHEQPLDAGSGVGGRKIIASQCADMEAAKAHTV